MNFRYKRYVRKIESNPRWLSAVSELPSGDIDKIKKNLVHRAMLLCNISNDTIKDVMTDTAKRYKIHYIRKSNGEKRKICVPDEELMKLQRMVMPFITVAPCSTCATAYESGTKLKDNAEAHRKSKHVLHLDIRKFFPTIDRKMFSETYSKYYNADEINLLWAIVSYDGGLAIGSPTSPFIANRVVYSLDKKLNRISRGMIYTRYADDMIFSSDKFIKREKVEKLLNAVKKFGFIINPDKTYFMRSRRRITGLNVTYDNAITVGTRFKKNLKSDLYKFLSRGVGHPDIIRGKLAYLYDIEPEYDRKIRDKYSNSDNNGFLNFIK